MNKPTHGIMDGDILSYEFAYGTMEDGRQLPFEMVMTQIDNRIAEICDTLSLETLEGYLTGSNNFRKEVAVTKPYKGNRKTEKPFHYNNIRNYLEFKYGFETVDKYEADDAMAIRNKELERDCILITRDKDIRMIEGWHYGWECGRQGETELFYADALGEITENGKGYGGKFFWAQMIMGDTTDNIPALPRKGPKYAYKVLHDADTLEECKKRVTELYMDIMDGEWEEYMLEQGRLLYMHEDLDENGDVVLWQIN